MAEGTTRGEVLKQWSWQLGEGGVTDVPAHRVLQDREGQLGLKTTEEQDTLQDREETTPPGTEA